MDRRDLLRMSAKDKPFIKIGKVLPADKEACGKIENLESSHFLTGREEAGPCSG